MRETFDIGRLFLTILDNPSKPLQTTSSQEVEPPYREGTGLAVSLPVLLAAVLGGLFPLIFGLPGLVPAVIVAAILGFVSARVPSLVVGWWGPKQAAGEDERYAVRGRDIEDVTVEDIRSW